MEKQGVITMERGGANALSLVFASIPGRAISRSTASLLREYFGGRVVSTRSNIQLPLRLTATLERYDAVIKVVGGGVSGQAGLFVTVSARALVRSDDELRPVLKRAHLLTRDARVKERKKVGLKRARKAPQYTKR